MQSTSWETLGWKKHKLESCWVAKNWCFWTVVLEKTLESLLDCKEIQPVHSEGDQPWVFFGMTDAKAETPILWPPHAKSWLTGKDSDAWRDCRQEEKATTEDEMAGWHHWLDRRESEWTPGAGDGQWSLTCCNSWGHKKLDMTEWLNWTEWSFLFNHILKFLHFFTPIYLYFDIIFYIFLCLSWLLIIVISESSSVMFDSATPWIAARQASLSITNSRSSLRLTSISPY